MMVIKTLLRYDLQLVPLLTQGNYATKKTSFEAFIINKYFLYALRLRHI